jgi:hypothetical protein
MTELAPSIGVVTGLLIARLDERLPGRLDAFYLVGSIAMGDYQEGRSDIDFVAVLAGPLDISALAEIHAALARDYPDVHCDGIYLQPGELSAPPAGSGVEVRQGRVDAQSRGERHAVTWLTLADAGIALRGRVPDACWIAADRVAAIGHSERNLEDYWAPWLEVRRRLLSSGGMALLRGDTVAWGCLGIARLHATIATTRVLSKSGAGEYALTAFPHHAPIIVESLRLRREPSSASAYHSLLARRRDAIAFMDAVLGPAE